MRFSPCGMLLVFLLGSKAPAAELKLLLPQNRTAFQTNEWIDVSVVRSAPEKLPASDVNLTLTGDHGGAVTVTFAVTAVQISGKGARATEHLHINGWLLRPGKYAVEVACDGASARTDIEVFGHVRQSSFRLINWGRAKGAREQLPQGENSLGFNTF